MNPKDEMFFCLLCCAINDTALSKKVRKQFKTEYLEDFYSLAKKHDVAHLVAYVLFNEGLIPHESSYFEKFKKIQLLAGYRFISKSKEKERLTKALADADIPFVLLKGAIIQEFYPQAWMRTSCDIDVLVKEDDLDRARAVLSEKCGYTQGKVYTHDVSMFSEDGVHVELHYRLMEQNTVNDTNVILDKVWEYVDENGKMTDEFFYFYFIAHTAKHFQHGGCGIKPFLDLYIMENKLKENPKRDELLDEGGLLKFKQHCIKLINIWFKGKKCDEFSQRLTKYILNGGVYGNMESAVLVRRAKTGGKVRYVLSRMFLPYDVIRFHFPVLNKHKYLLPLFQVVRWVKIIFTGSVRRSNEELKISVNLTDGQLELISEMLNELGI